MGGLLVYNYAEIDEATNMCVGVCTSSGLFTEGPTGYGTYYVSIPVYDPEYGFKYYINGSWYEDTAGTVRWQTSLL